MIRWPNKPIVAQAYVDQLERSGALSAEQVASVRTAIQSGDKGKMSSQAGIVEKIVAKNATDMAATERPALDSEAADDVIHAPVRAIIARL